MVSQEVLRQIVATQKKGLGEKKDSLRRDILGQVLPWMKDKRVLILSGLRRSGKSTLLGQLMTETKGWGYANFEDERLLDFRAQDFELLNEALIEGYGDIRTYFFDEIQNIEKFETFVRRLQDEGKKVIITGSNASLLSKELGTRLTGRYRSFEVYPFSFSEYLRAKDVAVEKDDWYDSRAKVKLLGYYRDYLVAGGLPEYLKNQDKEYVRTLFENILYKDIITRYSIRKEKTIKELVNILATTAGSQTTYNSLRKALGLSNAITIKEYIHYLENSYLFFELLRASASAKRQVSLPRKVYLVDPAFHEVCGYNFTPNKGRNLENAVLIDLKRKGLEAYYYADRNECDFVIKEGAKMTQAIQVCYELDESNKEREVKGLLEAMDAFRLDEGLILTFDQADEFREGGKRIKVLPAPRWSLWAD